MHIQHDISAREFILEHRQIHIPMSCGLREEGGKERGGGEDSGEEKESHSAMLNVVTQNDDM
eukprot:855503-Amorphochlora_amoeboformis.AAC.1